MQGFRGGEEADSSHHPQQDVNEHVLQPLSAWARRGPHENQETTVQTTRVIFSVYTSKLENHLGLLHQQNGVVSPYLPLTPQPQH